MKKIIYLLGLISMVNFANAKVANDTFYAELGGGVGVTNYYSGNSGTSGMLRVDGGYILNEYVNFQAGINNYFSTTVNNSNLGTYDLSGWGWDATVLPTFGIGQNNPVNIFLRLGVGYDNINSNVGNMSNFIDVEGVGVRYDISSHLGITGQWMGRGLIFSPSPSNYNQNIFIANFGVFF